MIIDLILFNDELDLLELRLEHLQDVVDRFVIIEATKTFSGRIKPLHFQTNAARFDRWMPKITVVVVDDMPLGQDPWTREHWQRNAAMRALGGYADGDWVLLSDVDEWPQPALAASLAGQAKHEAFVLELRSYYYFLNCRCVTEPWWRGLKMTTLGFMRRAGGPQALRDKLWTDQSLRPVPDAGWHFSYLGGVEAVARKLADFSHHREYDNAQFNNPAHIADCLACAKDLFGRPIDWRVVPFDASYPAVLRQHQELIEKWIAPCGADDIEVGTEVQIRPDARRWIVWKGLADCRCVVYLHEWFVADRLVGFGGLVDWCKQHKRQRQPDHDTVLVRWAEEQYVANRHRRASAID